MYNTRPHRLITLLSSLTSITSITLICSSVCSSLSLQDVSAQDRTQSRTQSRTHERPHDKTRVFTTGELGMVAPLTHTIQFDKGGTVFDYVDDGGQDNAFPFARLQAEVQVKNRHSVIFLYQPLNLESRVYLQEEVIVDRAIFPADSTLDLRYGFDFYRVSYLYDIYHNLKSGDELSFGGSLQLRNATIDFTSGDGRLHRSNRDLGPVPLFKLRWAHYLKSKHWVGAEVDGMYAPVKYINGSDSDVVGAIIDLSVRYGIPLDQRKDLFFNLRWIGGGAEGTSTKDDGPGDGFTANWLNFVSFSIGLTWQATAPARTGQ